MNYLTEIFRTYQAYIPYFLISLFSAFLLTPVVAYFSRKYKVVDIPAQMRSAKEATIKTRIKKVITPRAGGLAVVLPFLILIPFATGFEKQLIGILIASSIIVISGVFDDKYEVSTRKQFIVQIIAALVVIAAGISIDSIQNPFNHSLNLRLLVIPLKILGDSSIALPADLITIVWIIILMNSINWVFGSDSLGEGITFIALITIFLINIQISVPLVAFISIIVAGGVLGFLPYNLPPSKILSGTTGTNFYGFIIAVCSIMGGAKVSSAIIVLIIPIIDMIWVMIGRIQRNHVTKLSDLLQATTTGDDTHLHHRLLKLGFSSSQVALIEWGAIAFCALIAFLTADLPKMVIIGTVSVLILISFLIISLLLKRGTKVNKEKEKKEGEGEKPPGPQETPESRYAY